jgi:hypothetical protein
LRAAVRDVMRGFLLCGFGAGTGRGTSRNEQRGRGQPARMRWKNFSARAWHPAFLPTPKAQNRQTEQFSQIRVGSSDDPHGHFACRHQVDKRYHLRDDIFPSLLVAPALVRFDDLSEISLVVFGNSFPFSFHKTFWSVGPSSKLCRLCSGPI